MARKLWGIKMNGKWIVNKLVGSDCGESIRLLRVYLFMNLLLTWSISFRGLRTSLRSDVVDSHTF